MRGGRLARWIGELERRHVFRVAVVYAAVAFIVWQVAAITFPALRFPEWAVTLVVVLAMLGFPLALVLAWAFDLTPIDMRRAGPAPVAATSDGREQWQRVGEILSAALEVPARRRSRFLDRACAGEPTLRGEVESLLAAHEEPGLLDRSAAALAAPLLAESAGAPLPAGATIAQYEILGELGSGGMAVVYKARDRRLGRTVALKFLPPRLSADEQAKERLLVEARAAAALDHPNICTIHEIGETDEGRLFIAMPFYEGDTLRARIARSPLPVAEAVALAIQVANGLACAHAAGIVHRDIKPANLVVLPEQRVKILDFGIAKLADVSLTRPGATPGTVAYMSPEQARGEAVDGRTDLWSLGVVLYEMLTGERPFRGDHEQVVLQAIQQSEPEPVSAMRADVPPPLERVIRRALSKRRRDRYRSARELGRDLERVRAGDGPPGPDAAALGDPRLGSARPGESDGPTTGGLEETERRQAAIVACALSGYAELVERLVPDELESLLAQLRQAAARIAGRHGGVLNRFTGEEIVLLFGIPTTHEDDAQRAVRAALELRDHVRGLGRQLQEQGGVELDVHGGADAGQIVAHPPGADGGGYRVTGAAVRIASRLAGQAPAAEIWVSTEMQRVIGPYFATTACEPLTVRERDRPLRPFRVERETGVETRLEAAELAGLTRYVGRDEELTALRRCLDAALSGEGQFVTVVGDPGMGKSRLLYELRRDLHRDRVFLLQGRCQNYGASIAYLPFIEMLRRGFGLGAPESGDRAADATRERIRGVAGELEEFVPLYLHLLSIHDPRYPVPKHLHGDQFRLAMQEALAALLTLNSRSRPSLLLLEDWHWADEASQAVLRQIVEMLAGYPLMVVVTHRPGYGVDWNGPPPDLPIRLRPLRAAETEAMLRSVLRVEDLPTELAPLLHERTAGNPFFLEEICHALLEDGALRVQDARATLESPLQALELPDTVQAVIRARLDRLEPAARETLRLAAVVGREFTRGILEHTDPDGGRRPQALQALRSAGLIQQLRIVPEPAYRFKHALTQEVAYGSLLDHQRRELHGRVGNAIEELHRDQLEEHLDRLAHHFSRAEEWGRAVEYGIRSAVRTEALAQFSDALQLLERTRRWLARLPQGDERKALLIEILLRQERLCETLGLRGRQQQLIDELIQLLEPSEDRGRLAETYLRQGDLYTLLRRFDEAEAALERSLRLRRELDDAVGERNTLRSLGLLRWHQDRNQEALAAIEQALRIDQQRGDVEAIVGDLSNLGSVLKALGRYDEARRHLERALELSEGAEGAATPAESELHLKRAYILHHLGNVAREQGDNERALEHFRQADALTREKRLPIQDSFHLTAIAHIYLQEGRIEESLQHYREAVELTRRADFAPGLAQSLRMLGEVLLGLGREEEALAPLEEAAALFAQLEDAAAEGRMWARVAETQERRHEHAAALAAWGRARTSYQRAAEPGEELAALEGIARATRRYVDEPSLALGYCRDALELARGLADTAAEARIRNTIGILEWKRGNYGEALTHYERALEIYRAAGDHVHAGLMLNSAGATLKALGQWDAARARLQHAVATHRQTGQPRLEGHALALLGEVHAELGSAGKALECFEQSLRIRRRIGDRRGEGWMLHHAAQAHLADGASDRARQLTTEAEAVAREIPDDELAQACERLRRMPGS